MHSTIAEERDDQHVGRGLIVFFAIAFGVPWAGWIFLRASLMEGEWLEMLAFAVMPAAVSVAGFAAAYAEGGSSRLKNFMITTLSPRVHPAIWLIALFAPLAAAGLVFAARPGDLVGQGAPQWAMLLAGLTLMNLWTGPLAEEFGWRGYLLQRLNVRFSIPLAALIIGPIWAIWHLPLFYDSVFASSTSAGGYLLWVCGGSIILSLVTAMARGSVWPAVLGHWALNAQAGIFSALLPGLPGEKLPGGWGVGLATIIGAVLFLIVMRRQKSLRKGSLLPTMRTTALL